jgi:hypothetical protein
MYSSDIMYLNFNKKTINTLQNLFKDTVEKVHFTNTSRTFFYIFSFVSFFINDDVYQKIKFDTDIEDYNDI